MSNDNGNRTGEAPPVGVTLVYSTTYNTDTYARIVTVLNVLGVTVLPRVDDASGDTDADAAAWMVAKDRVAVRINAPGTVTVLDERDYYTVGEFADALARTVLGEPTQCLARGCTASAAPAAAPFCSDTHAEIWTPRTAIRRHLGISA